MGVASRVAVGEPTTRVEVGVAGPSTAGAVGISLVRVAVRLGKVRIEGVEVPPSRGAGAEVKAANPRQ